MSHRHVNPPASRRGGRRAAKAGQGTDSVAREESPTATSAASAAGGAAGGGGGDGEEPSAGGDDAKKRSLPVRLLRWTALALVLVMLAGLGTFLIAYAVIDIPDPNQDFQTEKTEVYYSDGKHLLGTFAIQNREAVELARVPEHVKDAVVSAEDRTFWDNAGIDLRGIVRAAWSNARSNTTQGASTITQQYVKILYLSQERTWSRKIKEAILSLKVQRRLSKEQVLQGYLNTIYFGRGAYGIQAAAEAYFDKNVEDLTPREGVVLAAVLNNPGALDPAGGKQERRALLGRYQYILDGMAEMGDLHPKHAEKLSRKGLPTFAKVKETNRFGGQKGHLMQLVEQRLLARGFTQADIYGGGLRVVTTFDYQAQKAAANAVKKQRPKGYKQLHVSLSSVEPGTGAVRALYAGHNFLSDAPRSQINWATWDAVQPGSAFKPFALAAGLRNDFELDDTLDGSSPYYLNDEEYIENQGDSGGESFGPVSLEYATERSINTAYVDLTKKLGDDNIRKGARKILRAAESAGIPSSIVDKIDPVPVTSLGYAPVPNIDMANAYATFAAEGEKADWYAVEKVTDSNGEVLYNHRVTTERAFSRKLANTVSYALQNVIVSGTGTNAELRCPAAGKTGTATAGGDDNAHVSSSLFVGYTPKLATAVTYSRGDGNNRLDGWLDTFYGGDHPAETWRAYMQKALKGEKCVKFPEMVEEETEPTETTPETSAPPETTPPETTEPTETTPPTSEVTETTPPTTEPSETQPTGPPTSEPTPTEPSDTCDPLCDPPPGQDADPDG